MNILDKIVNTKRDEVEEAISAHPLEVIKEKEYFYRKCYSLKEKLMHDHSVAIIAEYKRRSPSIPAINLDAQYDIVIPMYQKAGAQAISILTDFIYFGGRNHYLTNIRDRIQIPILRKEFIIDPYQIYESKALGADIILLISEILDKSQIEEFTELSHSLGLEVLLELHSEEQLEKLYEKVDFVGINNRNLKTFKVDIEQSKRIFEQLPHSMLKISESGLSNPTTVANLHQFGFNGFLIGETFMKSKEPGETCRNFINKIKECL